jgi:glycosyltransferase involved in cell wall biosynthesis
VPFVHPQAQAHVAPVIAFIGRIVTTRVWKYCSRPLESLLDGPERAQLEDLAHRWDCVRMCNFWVVPEAKVQEILAQTNFVVVPSIGRELFGVVVAENMLRGLTSVVSDLSAFQEVVGDAGVTFRTGETADLAAHTTQREIRRTFWRALGPERRTFAGRQGVYLTDKEHAKIYGRVVPRKRP